MSGDKHAVVRISPTTLQILNANGGAVATAYSEAIANRIATALNNEALHEEALAFTKRMAALTKWGEPDENGEPFQPSDGLEDSHECLMSLIDRARALLARHEGDNHG